MKQTNKKKYEQDKEDDQPYVDEIAQVTRFDDDLEECEECDLDHPQVKCVKYAVILTTVVMVIIFIYQVV